MMYQIKCDQLHDEWNFDTCMNCKHFRSGADINKRWRCKLNTESEYRRRFHMIWLIENAISAGIMSEADRDQVSVEYIGKKKRKES